MSGLTHKLSGFGLRVTEATILIAILKNPRITQSEIGRMLGIASANVAPLIGRLDNRDLIERIPVDGRSHGLTLTPAGQELSDDVFNVIKSHEDTLMKHIPTELQDDFINILNNLWESESD
tara:strand:- start:7732 stop:8094 length:363 start_codon:yes stop_codon:yes gene_type:complete